MPGPEPQGAPPTRPDADLTHVDGAGRARMVDVTAKPWTHRRAVARGRVRLGDAGAAALAHMAEQSASGDGAGAWGGLFDAARIAGIQAAKQTSTLIPLCHALTSSDVKVSLWPGSRAVEIESRAEVVGPTGVEMEALTACTVAALTVAAALLPIDPHVEVDDVTLWEKSGGRSGTWLRP